MLLYDGLEEAVAWLGVALAFMRGTVKIVSHKI
jgi:hypothetical protein